jgi:lipopolysaccharide/colanic/teichoic acid biosynthesis glycosyltransferase
MLKRTLDLVVGFVGIIFLSPLVLAIALAIKVESPGPVFYRGVRVGRFGKPFRIFKFRSMVVDEEKVGAASTHEHDPRVTRAGRWIRRFKLDELPQLFNVLLGDMSLVGPRPEVEKFVDLYTEAERPILSARPGITDWASIRFHNEGEIIAASGIADADQAYAQLIRPEKLRLQLKYVAEQGFFTDLRILTATLATLVHTRMPGRDTSSVNGEHQPIQNAGQEPTR